MNSFTKTYLDRLSQTEDLTQNYFTLTVYIGEEVMALCSSSTSNSGGHGPGI